MSAKIPVTKQHAGLGASTADGILTLKLLKCRDRNNGGQ
jgi:hypothetical protein